jgi:nitrite reductase/ring-hydroxylating ferredoxin subunit
MAQQFKLKGLSTLGDIKDLDKVEAEVDGIEGGKVLLVKVGDQVHALNANCTHYGAPLKTGVVTPEGRLTCPWHGGKLHCPNSPPFTDSIHDSLFQRQVR